MDLVEHHADVLFEGLDEAGSWSSVIGAVPEQDELLTGERFAGVLEALADYTDVKSPFTLGHWCHVVDLACEAASVFGLSADGSEQVRRAGLRTTSGVSACPTPSGTSVELSLQPRWSASGSTPIRVVGCWRPAARSPRWAR